MTTIDLKSLLKIEDLKEGSGFSEPSIKINMGYDKNLYVLLKETAPPPIVQGIVAFPNTNADTKYCGIIYTIDWDRLTITKKKIIQIGELHLDYYQFLPLGDEYLLVACRSWNKKNGPEKNALVIDKEGTKLREFCLGDGISQTITTPDEKIITGYFDEGVFGNFGWNEPIGSCGLIAWDKNGNQVWRNNKYGIDDVYAMDYFKDNLYFYFYYDFYFVKTDFTNDKVFKIGEKGFNSFTISDDESKIIVDGGYDNHSSFYVYEFGEGTGTNKQKVTFEINGNKVENVYPVFLGNSKLIFEKDGQLYASNFI